MPVLCQVPVSTMEEQKDLPKVHLVEVTSGGTEVRRSRAYDHSAGLGSTDPRVQTLTGRYSHGKLFQDSSLKMCNYSSPEVNGQSSKTASTTQQHSNSSCSRWGLSFFSKSNPRSKFHWSHRPQPPHRPQLGGNDSSICQQPTFLSSRPGIAGGGPPLL